MKIKIVCSHCQSENVVRDAWAEWDLEKQDWILQNVFDYSYCLDCEQDYSLEEEPLDAQS